MVVAAAVGLRVAYVLLVLDDVEPGFDALWYLLQGSLIEGGTGYVVPTSIFEGRPLPTASFPPAYPAWQALWQAVVGGGVTSARLAGIVPGLATVVLTALLGRRLLGARFGLVAAALVALDPAMVAVDGSTMSENLGVPLTVASVLAALRIADEGLRPAPLLALGVLGGAATLTRQDLVLLAALLAVVAVVLAPAPAGGRTARRVEALVAVAVVGLAVVGPWMWRNHERLGTWAISTTSPSSALAGSNCEATYRGPDLGSWDHDCVVAAVPDGDPTEVEVAAAQREAGLDHLRSNLDRLPLVLAARQARVWALWDPGDLAERDADETRDRELQVVARAVEGPMLLAGLAGLLLVVRRRRRTWPVTVVPFLVVAASAAATYGNPRFNSIAHPLAAVGLVALVGWVVARRRSPAPPPDPTGSVTVTEPGVVTAAPDPAPR